MRREQRIAVAPSLALLDSDPQALAVDVADLEADNPEARRPAP